MTMMAPATSVWLVAAYALVLVAIAWGFDLMARKSSARSSLAHGTIRLPRRPRRLGLPAGSVAVAHVVRPDAPRRALSGSADRVQQLSDQEHLHHVEPRS